MIRNSLRERYEKKRKERQDILGSESAIFRPEAAEEKKSLIFSEDTEAEKCLVNILAGKHLILPTNSIQIMDQMSSMLDESQLDQSKLYHLLQKIAQQNIIEMKSVSIRNEPGFEIIQINSDKLYQHYYDVINEKKCDDENWIDSVTKEEPPEKKHRENSNLTDTSDIMSLLSMPSAKEKQHKQVGEEILELLSKPTAKELQLTEKFRSQGGTQVMEFCPHGTRVECLKAQQLAEENMSGRGKINWESQDSDKPDTEQDLDSKPPTATPSSSPPIMTLKCNKLHFKKIIQAHTDVVLGDCSFLNTCFHMETCKYVHYQVDNDDQPPSSKSPTSKSDDGHETSAQSSTAVQKRTQIEAQPKAGIANIPPQWIQCDLRYLDMSCLGKFAVIMADPPWDIHMELPYGTLSDDEMRELGVPALQDDGLIFLWVTGRAMELGRECLKLWGYERVDELIWVKTNQLQRIIRTGRTGHWLNHGKEHCLVGMKGNPVNMNRGLDCDVIVAEVRATSHKPDEIYGMIERLSPGTRKIELFGRQHNVQPNWLTIGNQLDGIKLVDPDLISSFQKRYPEGNCMLGKK